MPKPMTILIAAHFVEYVLKRRPWARRKPEHLYMDVKKVFLKTVASAGFEPVYLKDGVLNRLHCEDGNANEYTYPVNDLCPFTVVSRDKWGEYNNLRATAWLEHALRHVIYRVVSYENDNRNQVICQIAVEIERSIPLAPILLTHEGDFLCEYPPDEAHVFADHTRDTDTLGLRIGVHKNCGHWMERTKATESKDVLICHSCRLCVLFPREIQTYGELRKALALERNRVGVR